MRALFLNDLGFQYGAGIGHARQIQSLLLGGHTVGALCGAAGNVGDELLFTRDGLRRGWRGLRVLPELFRSRRHTEDELVDGILMAAAEFYPDLVVVGNLHGASWPLRLLRDLQTVSPRVVAYVHDLHLATGRCTYPEDCLDYLTGCGASCPTPHEYPALDPEDISAAWRLRREILLSQPTVALATNSDYMRRTLTDALPGASVRTVYLGADDRLFRPGDRAAARRRLGLPADGLPVVLAGAVSMSDRRKGGRFLPPIVERYGHRAHFVAFGLHSDTVPGVRPLGYRQDAAHMVDVYQAADAFLGTATAEAFGQVVLESSLCGVPSAAFAAGGVPELIVDGRTGLLAASGDVADLGDALGRLLEDAALREALGAEARRFCSTKFSLEQQLLNWDALLEPALA